MPDFYVLCGELHFQYEYSVNALKTGRQTPYFFAIYEGFFFFGKGNGADSYNCK